MNFNNLLNKLNELEQRVTEKSVLDSPRDSRRFGDQVSGTERANQISVLSAPSDPEHPFQDRLVGADESVDADLNEDLIAQLTQEFADFLRNKQPVMDNILPAAQDRELGRRAQDRTLTTEADPQAVAEGKAKPSKMSDTPADRRRQGRCVDCGQDLRTTGRGQDGRCRECEADQQG